MGLTRVKPGAFVLILTVALRRWTWLLWIERSRERLFVVYFSLSCGRYLNSKYDPVPEKGTDPFKQALSYGKLPVQQVPFPFFWQKYFCLPFFGSVTLLFMFVSSNIWLLCQIRPLTHSAFRWFHLVANNLSREVHGKQVQVSGASGCEAWLSSIWFLA